MVKNFIRLIQSNIQEAFWINTSLQINNVAIKLNKANAMKSKIRHYVDIKNLKSIFHAICESHLSYVSMVQPQN